VWRSYYLFQMPRWSRRLRIMLDWTVALLFSYDVVELDLIHRESSRRD
jgi:NADH dehydrogenase